MSPTATSARNVQISKPMEFGSQQKIRGPDDIKHLDQLRQEQGVNYDPLKQKRSNSISRLWSAIKRSVSRSRDVRVSVDGKGLERPAASRRVSCDTKPRKGEYEERGRTRRREGSEDSSRHGSRRGLNRTKTSNESIASSAAGSYKYHPQTAQATRYVSPSNASARGRGPSNQSSSGSAPNGNSPSASARSMRSARSNKSDKTTASDKSTTYPNEDRRKALGQPYDQDITSDWYWSTMKGRWRHAEKPGGGDMEYEKLSDEDYEALTCRKRGVYPPRSPTRQRRRIERSESRKPRHDLDKQVYFDEETHTYRTLDVRDTAAKRQAQTTPGKPQRQSTHGKMGFADPEPPTPWPSGFETTPGKQDHARTNSDGSSLHHSRSGSGGSSSSRGRARKPEPITVPNIKVPEAQAIQPPPASSIYPEDELYNQLRDSVAQPPVPEIPAQYRNSYTAPRASHAWADAKAASQRKSASQATFDLTRASPFLTKTAVCDTAAEDKNVKGKGKAKTQWETDTNLNMGLTDMPQVRIPGLAPIPQSTMHQDVRRLSVRADGASGGAMAISSTGRPLSFQAILQNAPSRQPGGSERARKKDTVYDIIDAYGPKTGATVATKWDDEQ